MRKIIGHAPCVLCESGPYPVKISDTGNLYMVCPPPFDGGCKSQFFCRDEASNQRLAASIIKWTIDKEERKRWVGEQTEQPDPETVEEELEEAIEDGGIQVTHRQEPDPPPPPARRPAPAPVSLRAPPSSSRPPRAKPKAKKTSLLGGLIEWGDEDE